MDPWLYASPECWSEDAIALPAEEVHHALAVLRLSAGAGVSVTDGAGRVARCRLAVVPTGAVAEIVSTETLLPPSPEIVVWQAAAKGHKVDAVIARLGSVGVGETRVFTSERSVARWDESKRRRLQERWEAIARGAAKQSRAGFVMTTGPPVPWPPFLDALEREPLVLVLWEEAAAPLRDALRDSARAAVVVGPEGGFSRPEVEEMAGRGARVVSLGERIVRAEDAALVAASALLYHYGLIG